MYCGGDRLPAVFISEAKYANRCNNEPEGRRVLGEIKNLKNIENKC